MIKNVQNLDFQFYNNLAFFGVYFFCKITQYFFNSSIVFGFLQSKITLSNIFLPVLTTRKHSKMSPNRISCSNNENITSFVPVLVKIKIWNLFLQMLVQITF